MLSTGVDIPALEFIVFLRPVKSRILWEQMLGRGTRRCDEISKSKFVVFDCFDGTLVPLLPGCFQFPNRGAARQPAHDLAAHREYLAEHRSRLPHSGARETSATDRQRHERRCARTFARWIPDGDVGRFAGELPKNLRDNFADTMKLLRNPEFQELLTDYPRAKRQFWVAHETRGHRQFAN